MNDLLIFALLFVATGLGWYLGRRSAQVAARAKSDLPSQYYRGLNYLLDGRPDGAVDAFIDALEVNSETLETHIALGNLLRKRGEVDRAIRIHQNLLARPSLPQAQVHQAHLELARDYISAGLFDRAERLLLDLIKESSGQRRSSQRYLLEIYQSQREWHQAIAVAKQLLPRKTLLGSAAVETASDVQGQPVNLVLAHYYCELASSKQAAGELAEAGKLLQQALSYDKHCVRASIMQGQVEQAAGNAKQAVKALRRVRQQDPDYIPETLATLRSTYADLKDLPAFRHYLQSCLEERPSAALLMALADDLRELDGSAAAAELVTENMTQQPSLRGLAQLIALQVDAAEGELHEHLATLQVFVDRLVEQRPEYRCGKCGFSGRQLHWYCPGCKYWGTIKAIRDRRSE